MLDIGWSELLVVAVVAIIVIGPKDLPRALKTAGQWVAKVRGIAREFQSGIDDMIRDSDLEDLKKEAQAITDFDLQESLDRQMDPTGSQEGVFGNEAMASIQEVAEPDPIDTAEADLGEPPTSETPEKTSPEPTSNRASG